MELPYSLRDSLVEDLDEYLEAVSSAVEAEAVANYVIELLETWADDEGIEDIVATLEEEGILDDTLVATLEEEMSSNDEFEYTGEEIVVLIERLTEIEWAQDEDDGDDFDDEEDDEDDEDDF